MSQLQYWVWLSMRFGVRPKVKLALVEHFGTPRDVYFATEADYRVRVPLRPEELRLLLDKDLKDANRALAICDREHIRVLTIQDAGPIRSVCCRSMTRRWCSMCAARCRRSMTVRLSPSSVRAAQRRMACERRVSSAPRSCAMAVFCFPVSPLGSTARPPRVRCTPAVSAWACPARRSIWILRAHARQETARCGAVVSEFAPNMSVPRFGFRLRNRITSGLAVATVVVEAPEKSGALLFADDAVTQGREVFAVPGNADSRCLGRQQRAAQGRCPSGLRVRGTC